MTNKVLLIVLLYVIHVTAAEQYNYFLCSIPKCGTHLALKCITKLTNKTVFTCPSWTHLEQQQVDQASDRIYKAHALCSKKNMQTILQNNFLGIFIIRDPRDQIISMAEWIKKHDIWKDYHSRSIKSIIKELLIDCRKIYQRQFSQLNLPLKTTLADFYNLFLEWQNQINILTIKFEDLVGSKGGGSDQAQKEIVQAIAQHLNINYSPNTIERIATSLFGSSYTFNSGKIGRWQKYFDNELKDLCKEIIGELLINLNYENDLNW